MMMCAHRDWGLLVTAASPERPDRRSHPGLGPPSLHLLADFTVQVPDKMLPSL